MSLSSGELNACDYFESLSNEDFLRQFEVDCLGVLNCVRAAAPYMKQHGGRIINISSLLTTCPLIGYSAFCAGKGAVQLALGAIQSEYQRYDIYIQHVLAPAVDTDRLNQEVSIREIDDICGESESHDCSADEFAPYVIKGIKSNWQFISYDKVPLYAFAKTFMNATNVPTSLSQVIYTSLLIIPAYWIASLQKYYFIRQIAASKKT